MIGLLGPNGAGKTTLLRMIATVLAPDAGDLRLLGLDPANADERLEIRRRLGYLPQSPGLYPGFTPFDLVDYVAVLKEHTDRAWRREETRRVLESVGLQDVMHKKIRALSGGMKQRVALAAAMIGGPDLLVLDEPATGLDPDQRLQLRSLLSAVVDGADVDAQHLRGLGPVPGRLRDVRGPGPLHRHTRRAGRARAGAGSGRTTTRTRRRSGAGSPPPEPSATSATRRRVPRWSSRPSTTATSCSLAGARVSAAWVAPTARAVPWQPLAGIGTALVGVSAVATYADRWPVTLLGLAAAGVAAATVAGLHDPAAALLAAVPTSAARRRAHRVALLAPVALLIWLGYVAVGHHWYPGLGWPLGQVTALATTGLALAAWWPADRTDVRVGAGVAAVLLWYAVARPGLVDDHAEVLLAWQHHPWIVSAVAVAALLVRRER